MLLHLIESVKVALASRRLGQVCVALSLRQVVRHLCFRDGQAAEFALLDILDAEVVVQLKRLLRVLFTATHALTEIRSQSCFCYRLHITCGTKMRWNPDWDRI